jgi:enterochelin esterase-like enzyme
MTYRRWAGLAPTLLAGVALAQPAAREPTPNDSLVSPLIETGTVRLQIYAPHAESVSVIGDWMTTREPLQLHEREDGVWSVALRDLRPDYYSYWFIVDGVKTIDPKNPEIKQGIRTVDSMFYLQGPGTEFQDNRPVPHGQVRAVWYVSKTLATQRRMHVYTPPGYDDNEREYPVLYLLHGGGDDDTGWSTIGRAGLILDNLIADGEAVPMVVVMPNGSLPPADLDDNASHAEREQAAFRFERELMNDVVPTVERLFRVGANAGDRAIAGLSMGGGHTTQVFGRHWRDFDYASVWSAGIFSGDKQEYETQYPDFLAAAQWINSNVEHVSIVVGTADFAHPAAAALNEVLDTHGIAHEFIETGGGHTWLNWRQYLHDYASQLFK